MLNDPDHELWRRILAFDEVSHEYWAKREDWPGAVVFTNTADDPGNVAVLRASPPDAVDALIERLVRHYRCVDMAPRVRVTPLSEPPDWPSHLMRHGFVETGEREVFMHLVGDLRRPVNPAVSVYRAPDEIDLETFVATQSTGFGLDGNIERGVETALNNLKRYDYDFLVAKIGDTVVGAISMLYGDGIVGMWGLATLEPYRRQGIGTTLFHWVVDEGRRRGAEIIYLSTEPESYAHSIYLRLGFVNLFVVDTFELPVNGHA
ncbi:MAG: GNAT family N-acetyltransferase [Anaerolineae bacterium]